MILNKNIYEDNNLSHGFLFFNWESSWQYQTMPSNIWLYLAIPDNTLMIPKNTKQFKTIPSNPKHYITNLASVIFI